MPEYKWDMKGYASKYGFYTGENLSRMEAERTLQLEPEPPKESDLNNYIIQAQQQKDLRYLRKQTNPFKGKAVIFSARLLEKLLALVIRTERNCSLESTLS